VGGGPGNLYQCPVQNDGSLGICTPNNVANWQAPAGVTFRSFGGTTYAYVADGGSGNNDGGIWQCTVDPLSGSLSSCGAGQTNGGAPADWEPNNSVVFSSFGGKIYAYIVDFGDSPAPGNVYKCSVDNTSGQLVSCGVSNGGVTSGWVPYQITFNAFGGNSFAYVADSNGANVDVCPIDNTTGDLTNCEVSNANIGSWDPTGITLGFFQGETYAFVGDGGDGIANVYQCSLNSTTGQLVNCVTNDDTDNTLENVWSPNGGVTFQ
jgi:hypothetical protein